MLKNILFIGILLLLMINNGCTPLPNNPNDIGPFVKMSLSLINKYGITEDELYRLQYFSDKYKIVEYKATTQVLRDTSIRKTGELTKEQIIKRYSYVIDKLTPGILVELNFDEKNEEYLFKVKYDTLVSACNYIKTATTIPANDYIYTLKKDPIRYNGYEYEMEKGEGSVLYIQLNELEQLIINRDKAKGLRVKNL